MARSPEELDESDALQDETPDSFRKSMAALYTKFGLKILGGCKRGNNQPFGR